MSPFQPHASSLQLPAIANFTCMHPAIPHLLELQTVDQHIAKLRAEQSMAVERKEIETQRGARKKDLEAALAERERALSPVPEDLRELYARIAKRHHGVALAEARDGQCRGCGMRVLPHILQQLLKDDSDELFRCESCAVILYSLEPIPAPNPENSSGSAASSASTSSSC